MTKGTAVYVAIKMMESEGISDQEIEALKTLIDFADKPSRANA